MMVMKGTRPKFLQLGLFVLVFWASQDCRCQTWSFNDSMTTLYCPPDRIGTVRFRSTGINTPPDLVICTHALEECYLRILRDFSDGAYHDTVSFFAGDFGSNTDGNIEIVDLDSDSDLDMVGFWSPHAPYTPEQMFAIRDVGGTFEYSVIGGAVPSTEGFDSHYSVTSFDVNSDGRMDVILKGYEADLYNPSYTIPRSYLLMQDGNGEFVLTTPTLPLTNYSHHADFDGDGLQDLFLLVEEGNVYLHNNGDGSFTIADTLACHYPPTDGPGLDFNGDGMEDFLVSSNFLDGHLLIQGYPGNNGDCGDPVIMCEYYSAIVGYWQGLIVADLNNDQFLDLIYKDGSPSELVVNYRIALGNGIWPMNAPTEVLVTTDRRAMYIHDLDADGDLDLVFHDFDCVYWLENLAISPVGVPANEMTDLIISPVPASDLIHVRSSDSTLSGSIEVIDGTGRKVLIAPLSSPSETLDVSHLAPGVYFVRLLERSGNAIAVKSIVVSDR